MRTAWRVAPTLLCLTFPAPVAGAEGVRLTDAAVPLRYRLELNVDPSSEGYGGAVEIDLQLGEPAATIALHARELVLGTVTATQGTRQQLIAGASVDEADPDLLRLRFAPPLARGSARLRVAFETAFEPRLNGLYHVRDGDLWYAFTQMEPLDARRAFPCFDEPRFKVPWDIAVTVPAGQLAFSNAPESARTANPDGTTTFRFAPTPPLPSYLVAIAAGPLEVIEGAREPVPLRLLAARGKAEAGRAALDSVPPLLAILTDYFGRPFPYAKLDLAALPEFVAGAMENPGLITFREEFLLLPPTGATTGTRRFMTVALAHELAHQWFGDLVTMKWWDDVWLNEGFATWMETKVVDRFDPGFRAPLELDDRIRAAMRLDALGRTGPVQSPVNTPGEALAMFDGIRFAKGAAVIRMLEAWLGEDAFRDGVRAYLKAHEWSNADSQDLLTELATASREEVGTVAASFLLKPGIPLVTAALECAPGRAPRIRVAQRPFLAAGATRPPGPEPLWRIPLKIGFAEDGRPRTARFLLTTKEATFDLSASACPEWIYPNAEETGYYHFTFAREDDWRTPRALSARERVGLLGHASALVDGGELEAGVLLDLAAASAGDPDRAVASAVSGVLDRVGNTMVEPDARRAFRSLTGDLLRPLALAMGFVPAPGEQDDARILRQELLATLWRSAEDPWLRSEAEHWAPLVLRDPAVLDPDTASLALAVSSRGAGPERHEELRLALAAATTPSQRLAALRALAAPCDAAILRQGLDLALTDAVRAQDVGAIVDPALRDRENREVARDWMRERFPELRAKLHPWSLDELVETAIGSACSDDETARVEASFADLARTVDGGARAVERGLDRALACAAVRRRAAPQVARWLAQHADKTPGARP